MPVSCYAYASTPTDWTHHVPAPPSYIAWNCARPSGSSRSLVSRGAGLAGDGPRGGRWICPAGGGETRLALISRRSAGQLSPRWSLGFEVDDLEGPSSGSLGPAAASPARLAIQRVSRSCHARPGWQLHSAVRLAGEDVRRGGVRGGDRDWGRFGREPRSVFPLR